MNRSFWYIAISGLCALFVGLGLCRFAYTAIMPSLIHQKWVSLAGAGYIGTSNLLGYLLAVYLGKKATRYYSLHTLIKFSLILAIISLALCAIHWGFLWLAIWRFFAGIAGALLMIMTPAAVLKHVPVAYKGRAAGIVFTGIGLGIIVSGFVLPIFSKHSVALTWIVTALLALLASLFAWPAFRTQDALIHAENKKTDNASMIVDDHTRKALWLMSLAYLAYGIGMVPHTLFLVAYVNHAFKLSVVISGIFWSLFGVGAAIGPLCIGMMADKIGYYKALLYAFGAASLGIFIMVIYPSIILCCISSFIMGMLLPAIPSLISSRILELVGLNNYPHYWGHTTLYCAISQAAAAYLMSYLLHLNGLYLICFIVADIIFFCGLIAVFYSKVTVLESTQGQQRTTGELPTG
jgi:predicted MFS family arabinose efflux permease